MVKLRGKRKSLSGMVIKDSMDKTVVVSVERVIQHPLYGKYIKSHVRYMAHDEDANLKVGDRVIITESRPLSRMKRWRVTKVLEKGK